MHMFAFGGRTCGRIYISLNGRLVYSVGVRGCARVCVCLCVEWGGCRQYNGEKRAASVL